MGNEVGGATLCLKEAMEQFLKGDESILDTMCEAHPQMACILVAAHACRLGGPAKARAILAEMETATAQIAKKAAATCQTGDTILTHSASGTVREALLEAHKTKNIKVIATESDPGFEGRDLAQYLDSQGVNVTLIPDTQVVAHLPSCQAVWLGADAVGPDFFVNKIGSLPITLAANRLRVPVLALYDRLKILPPDTPYPDDLGPIFERIPLSIVTCSVSNKV